MKRIISLISLLLLSACATPENQPVQKCDMEQMRARSMEFNQKNPPVSHNKNGIGVP